MSFRKRPFKRKRPFFCVSRPLETVPSDMLQAHLGMVYLHRFYTAELEWLDEVINQLDNNEEMQNE
ncbi:MAG: hypothetical protein GY943_13275 [Chloroflexi bacterium]|nr:hypothetical protein [Chloroflexota bacterium]